MYYAIAWSYGRACDDQGNRIGQYYAFDRRAERDRFVSSGSDYVTEPGAREAIPASDPEIRKARRTGTGIKIVYDWRIYGGR